MKILKYIPLALVALGLVSCEKHEITFPMHNVNDMAQVQLHYFVPMATSTANNIFKVELGDQVIVQPNNAAVISTNNGTPGGAGGRFYTVKDTETTLRYYKGASHELVYDRNIKLIPNRKQNVIVYDFDKDPLIIDTGYGEDGFSFDVTPTYQTDSVGYIRFYNLLYESPGVPYQGKLQYQSRYRSKWLNNDWTEWRNVGKPVGFGECTDWETVSFDRPQGASYGNTNIYYRLLDEDGNELQIMNASGKYVNYSDYWGLYVGRRNQHFLRGYRTDNKITCAVSQWLQY